MAFNYGVVTLEIHSFVCTTLSQDMESKTTK
jgi:hypothetical protein